MSTENKPKGESVTPAESPRLFAAEPPRESRNAFWAAVGVAALLVIVLGALYEHAHRGPAGRQGVFPLDPYAASLLLTEPVMSQSTSLSGGTSTFLDGKVRNAGAKTVTDVTLQVLFRNDEGLAPVVETVPLSLIRTKQPYVDTEPVRAAPLKAGDEREFRLIFEKIPENWNQQMPEIHVVGVTTQ